MTVNFDILVSGCNTRCKHCYVNGGPGSMMKLEDAFLFIEKLDALAELLPFEASFTLDICQGLFYPEQTILSRTCA